MNFTDYACGISIPDCPKLAINWKNDNDLTICMSILILVIELYRLSFIRDWPEIRKSEIPSSEFCPMSGDGGELWIPKLAWMFLIEYYWMLQHARGYSFYCFWVIKGKPTGGITTRPSPRLGLVHHMVSWKSKFK